MKTATLIIAPGRSRYWELTCPVDSRLGYLGTRKQCIADSRRMAGIALCQFTMTPNR